MVPPLRHHPPTVVSGRALLAAAAWASGSWLGAPREPRGPAAWPGPRRV